MIKISLIFNDWPDALHSVLFVGQGDTKWQRTMQRYKNESHFIVKDSQYFYMLLKFQDSAKWINITGCSQIRLHPPRGALQRFMLAAKVCFSFPNWIKRTKLLIFGYWFLKNSIPGLDKVLCKWSSELGPGLRMDGLTFELTELLLCS